MAGQWHRLPSLRAALHGQPGAERAVHRHRNRPNRICDGKLDNPTVEKWFDTSCFVCADGHDRNLGDAGRNILDGPGQFNIDASLIKNTKFGRIDTEIRIEAFNLLTIRSSRIRAGNIGNQFGTRLRPSHTDAVEPVLLALRHDRAAGPDRSEDAVLTGLRAPGSGLRAAGLRTIVNKRPALQVESAVSLLSPAGPSPVIRSSWPESEARSPICSASGRARREERLKRRASS